MKQVRTKAQQQVRMRWGNIVRMYKVLSPYLKYAFEQKTNKQSDYNIFVKRNTKECPIYLSKNEIERGACVVAPYQVSLGSLQTIVTKGEGATRTTDIALGDLVIDQTTTIGSFANAVVNNNIDYDYDDVLSFIYTTQYINEENGIPYVKCTSSKVKLIKGSTEKLWDIVDKHGFISNDGFLANSDNGTEGGFVWIHSRNKGGNKKVSSQTMIVNNSILEEYTSDDAYQRAVATYGGDSSVFLYPSDNEV